MKKLREKQGEECRNPESAGNMEKAKETREAWNGKGETKGAHKVTREKKREREGKEWEIIVEGEHERKKARERKEIQRKRTQKEQ